MRKISVEVGKCMPRWIGEHDGVLKYMSGVGIDIGYRGEVNDAQSVLEGSIGVDMDFPGYDGINLPFADESLDYVFSSHMLEHSSNRCAVIREWYRVLRTGGHIIAIVPHKFLYEKKQSLPSRYNGDHKVFYTPASLLSEIEKYLRPNSYRLRMLKDCDKDYDYSIPPEFHSGGEYQIEMVIQKITEPLWGIE